MKKKFEKFKKKIFKPTATRKSRPNEGKADRTILAHQVRIWIENDQKKGKKQTIAISSLSEYSINQPDRYLGNHTFILPTAK